MGVGTAHTPGLTRGNASSSREHTVRYGSKANALVGARHIGSTEHREALRSQVLEVVPARTIGVDRLHVERVARTSRDVLDRQGTLHGPAPLVARMAGDLGSAVVAGVVVMRSHRKMNKNPSLVHD